MGWSVRLNGLNIRAKCLDSAAEIVYPYSQGDLHETSIGHSDRHCLRDSGCRVRAGEITAHAGWSAGPAGNLELRDDHAAGTARGFGGKRVFHSQRSGRLRE